MENPIKSDPKFAEICKLLTEARATPILFYNQGIMTHFKSLNGITERLCECATEQDAEGWTTTLVEYFDYLKECLTEYGTWVLPFRYHIPTDGKLGELIAKLQYAIALR